jgi:truncated hemoglobin YjbI
LRPFFPGRSLHCATEEFAAFLVQFLGGPSEDSQWRRHLALRESHRRLKIVERHREVWLHLMNQAMDDVGIAAPAQAELRSLFEHASAHVIDGPAPARPVGGELGRRWNRQQRLEEAVAALRAGDGKRAVKLAAKCDEAVVPGLLALMIVSGARDLLAYVHERLAQEPHLIRQRYGNRTLLHTAAAAGRLTTVELLLRLGADPDALDGAKHTPLYCVGNECAGAESAEIVRALVRSGAQVDARDGLMRTTALHMAARRGNAVVAKALLECGADIDARDSRGDTPLQRAVKCRKPHVAELLRKHRSTG